MTREGPLPSERLAETMLRFETEAALDECLANLRRFGSSAEEIDQVEPGLRASLEAWADRARPRVLARLAGGTHKDGAP